MDFLYRLFRQINIEFYLSQHFWFLLCNALEHPLYNLRLLFFVFLRNFQSATLKLKYCKFSFVINQPSFSVTIYHSTIFELWFIKIDLIYFTERLLLQGHYTLILLAQLLNLL